VNDDSKKAIDDDTLLAYREGLLNAETHRQVEERLRFSREDRERLAAFDSDLDFVKSTFVSADGNAAPNVWAIRQRIRKTAARRKVVQAIAVAAAVLVVTSAFLMPRGSPNKPAQQVNAREYTDTGYLQAAMTQIEYETELLRMRQESIRTPLLARRANVQPVYGETATILLESARYWEKVGGDSDMSRVRYAEILVHFPDSAAAAEIVNDKPTVLFGDRTL